ncbi:hypothetical protein AYK20_07940 [Thermoplasmatales archaeon SG8-52-1]|nr:MAG: hypothetical protein AYK20_07940 [Thermoplasmatales archaeon SG8-52-1]
MKDEPDIIKELRQQEKLGILKSRLVDIFDINEEQSTLFQTSSGTINVFEKPIKNQKKVSKNQDISKLKNIENKLIESEDIYKTIFENSAVAIIITDENEKIISWNKYAETLLDLGKNNLFMKPVESLYPPEEWKKIRKENIRQKGIKHSFETKIYKKKKEPLDINISISVLKNNAGEIIGSIGVINDISKQKKIEKELIGSENRFRNIFNATSDLLFYLEKDIILDINEKALEIGGLKKEKIVSKPFSVLNEIFSEQDMKKHLEVIKYANKGVKLPDYESIIKSNDSYQYRYLFSVDYIRDDKEFKGIILRGRDITKRQKAWEELVKLEERYRVLAETSADGVITIDPLGRLTYVNPSFEKLLKRSKSKILATLFRDYLSEDSVYFFQQVFISVRQYDEKIENIELELIDTENKAIPIEVNIAPVKKNKQFAGMVCTIRDITERRKIEDELKKSEKLKTEFMNIAAHELKSPVTPIKGYLDLIISDKDTSEKVRNWAQVSLRNSERLLKLVNDILDVSRLDTDTMRFEMEKIDTVKILDEIAEDMRPTIECKNLKLETKIPRDLPKIMGDRNRLPQVLKNLFVNAIKFTDNGSITLEAEKKENYILISIKDTGIGIPKDELKKIFNKFYQAYTSDDRKNEGTGLGLFISKEIIQRHNGQIWAESEIGKGSNFFIKIPYLHQMVVNLKE